MKSWLTELHKLQRASAPCVLVSVCGSRGSTPRETGAKMLVTRDAVIGSIGGGRLEHSCVQTASEWLRSGNRTGRTQTRRLVLGANCGQCCGGVAEILFEEITPAQEWWIERLAALYDQGIPATMVTVCAQRSSARKWLITADSWWGQANAAGMNPSLEPPQAVLDAARRTLDAAGDAHQITVAQRNGNKVSVLLEPLRRKGFEIAVFGAGHVGSACVSILAQLETSILWIDSRPNLMPEEQWGNVQSVVTEQPELIVNHLPAGFYALVMTHDHALDFELCAAILRRADVGYCGLIGSTAKRQRFVRRFKAAGLLPAQIARLTCPIGIDLIAGKRPAEIAVAVAADLQHRREQQVRSERQAAVSISAAGAVTRTRSAR